VGLDIAVVSLKRCRRLVCILEDAALTTRHPGTRLFKIKPTDPVTYLAAAGLLFVTSLVAYTGRLLARRESIRLSRLA